MIRAMMILMFLCGGVMADGGLGPVGGSAAAIVGPNGTTLDNVASGLSAAAVSISTSIRGPNATTLDNVSSGLAAASTNITASLAVVSSSVSAVATDVVLLTGSVNTVNATITGPQFTTATSGSISVTGTTSTLIFAANTADKYRLVVWRANSDNCYLSLTGTASPNWGIPLTSAGASYAADRNNLHQGQWAACCPTVSGSGVIYWTKGQ
jgi:hypothetical protein